MKKSQNLIWIDLEMTGLEPKHDRIIEIATIVTDSNLNILAEGPDIAIHHSQRVLDLMDEWNVKHHGESGLIQRVQESKITCKKAEAMT
ncbi:MAG: oligoribonuclease, partial [Gammaproteobacteria bacterium]|nr:oligoribonuclease [Gammaproteobacteria bacterium]